MGCVEVYLLDAASSGEPDVSFFGDGLPRSAHVPDQLAEHKGSAG